jgi:hypothetical protein
MAPNAVKAIAPAKACRSFMLMSFRKSRAEYYLAKRVLMAGSAGINHIRASNGARSKLNAHLTVLHH